jgi:hypothetical protein
VLGPVQLGRLKPRVLAGEGVVLGPLPAVEEGNGQGGVEVDDEPFEQLRGFLAGRGGGLLGLGVQKLLHHVRHRGAGGQAGEQGWVHLGHLLPVVHELLLQREGKHELQLRRGRVVRVEAPPKVDALLLQFGVLLRLLAPALLVDVGLAPLLGDLGELRRDLF